MGFAAARGVRHLEDINLRHFATTAIAALTIGIFGAATSSAMSADPTRLASNQTTTTTVNSHIHRNATDCVPDQPSAVWGANNQLLGYECLSSAQGQ